MNGRKPPQRRFGARDQRTEQPEVVPGLAARLVAASAVADVMSGANALDDRFAPDGSLSKAVDLDPRDKALARSIATVSLRRLGTIRSALGKLLENGMPRKAGALEWILVTGAAQLLFLDVPDHAAVDLAVRAVRRDPKTAAFAALTNAVLRNVARRAEELRINDDVFVDTPPWLATRWRKTYGEETARAIAAAHQMEPTLDITVRDDEAGWAEKLGGKILPTGSIRIASHQPVIELPGFDEGQWWVQDVSAAIPARLLHVRPGERIADLCAAPGGKAAQLATAGAQVVALDRSAERLKRLSANLARLGLDAEMQVGDATSYSGGPFDAVLLDAPCSSTGTIRRHPDVAWSKKTTDLSALATVQSRMLDRATRLLVPGGRLVYCVCSLEPEEGEQQIAALLRRNPDVERSPIMAGEAGVLAEWINAAGELRTLPSHLPDADPRAAGMDGFFAARLRRRG
jgi:16S rRNA (cytosine967-C5)-methyltransferase